MSERDVIHGSMAAALGAKLCNVDVIAAYPITPQTHIVEDLAKMVADGELDTEYMKVESEHSAMSACIGASATGARTFTATSSQGLALMHEVLFIASGMRLPIVMVNANRALSAPINIWNDQQDAMAERDCGWIQLYCETNQEVLDTTIQAFRIAEDKDVLLPMMVNLDGFVLTHTIEPVEVPDREQVKKYLPDFVPQVTLDPDDPMTQGAFADPSSYMEFRFEQECAMDRALNVIKKADEEFGEHFSDDPGEPFSKSEVPAPGINCYWAGNIHTGIWPIPIRRIWIGCLLIVAWNILGIGSSVILVTHGPLCAKVHSHDAPRPGIRYRPGET